MTEIRTVDYGNGTKLNEQYFDWDSKQKGLVLSSFFYGLATQLNFSKIISNVFKHFSGMCALSSLADILATGMEDIIYLHLELEQQLY